MKVSVGDVSLFFDVEGLQFVPEGPRLRERPTLLLLHGGPGLDHSGFKPAFSQFADLCQVVYLDHRGNGRSDAGDPTRWTLAQWGDDVRSFCEALGIERPIVMGQSFGGFVALSYATRHPDHIGKLILSSTSAQGRGHLDRRLELFQQFGGRDARPLAQRVLMTEGFTEQTVPEWASRMMPLYNPSGVAANPDALDRIVLQFPVMFSFDRPGGEGAQFDLLPDVSNIHCPTLILGGELDPMTPIECQEDIARVMSPELVRFERFPNCGHGVYRDDPRALDVIREFVVG